MASIDTGKLYVSTKTKISIYNLNKNNHCDSSNSWIILTTRQQLPQPVVHHRRSDQRITAVLVRAPAHPGIALQLLKVTILGAVQGHRGASFSLQFGPPPAARFGSAKQSAGCVVYIQIWYWYFHRNSRLIERSFHVNGILSRKSLKIWVKFLRSMKWHIRRNDISTKWPTPLKRSYLEVAYHTSWWPRFCTNPSRTTGGRLHCSRNSAPKVDHLGTAGWRRFRPRCTAGTSRPTPPPPSCGSCGGRSLCWNCTRDDLLRTLICTSYGRCSKVLS